jgi:pyruvate dehydrogenase E2 component (dihydrolipoamide acetyltransferase)/2-oxoglutarate dehydrogenase E2 component (dihydrolipoamide succinyltransferase)
MAEYIAIPKLGMSMTEATLVEWKAGEGDNVKQGDVVLTIETEKTQWDVEAAASGLLHIVVAQDEIAPVARVVGMIAESPEELGQLQSEPAQEIFTASAGPDGAAPPGVAPSGTAPSEAGAAAPAAAGLPRREPGERIRISPVARKMAEEHMIDIATITGTGPEGRIVREDVERAIQSPTPAAPAAAVPAPGAAGIHEGKRVKSTIPLRSIRKSIADHMQRSLAVSAQLTSMGEIDMTEVKKLRSALVQQEEKVGARITYTDILVVAIARALLEVPIINSSIAENEIKLWEDINIGVAVALEGGMDGGLIVPVVRNADGKRLLEINAELKGLVDKARTGKLVPDDVSGGTFTLTNLGAFGGGYGFGTPIINQPQSAILGTGPITDRPVVRDGEIVVQPIMTYSFTFDHRAIDGAPAAMFMLRLTELLENPGLLLL